MKAPRVNRHHNMIPFLKYICLALCLISIASCKPKSFDAIYREAEAKVGLSNIDGALVEYRRLANQFPDDPRRPGILMRIAELYNSLVGNDDLAIESYGRVINEYPLTEAGRQAREKRIALLEKKGRKDEVIEDYYALIKYFPEYADRDRYRMLLVGAYLAQRNYPQARTEIKPLVEEKGISPEIREQALFAAAESYFLEDKAEKAAPFYQALLKEFPNSNLASESELHLATCIEEMGYLGPARDLTKDAAKDYPNPKVIDARLKSIEDRGTPAHGAKSGHVTK